MKKWTAAALLAVLLSVSLTASAGSSAVLKLPSSLKNISDEAFCSCSSISRVEISSGTIAIGDRAFAHSALREIVLPESIQSIADDAFAGCDIRFIEAPTGSFAYDWALSHGYDVLDTTSPGEDELPWVPA